MTMEGLLADISELRLEVTRHPLFFRAWSHADLKLIMEHHVVAVWDFMALAKALQRGLTCIESPWLPPEDPLGARIINEIILAEETDQIEEIGFVGSHFELYLAAMDEVGANTAAMERFLAALATGTPLLLSLESSGLPAAAHRFMRHTLAQAQKPLHEVAASFLFGREDIIPEMFERILPSLPEGRVSHFKAYLERHIHIDGGQHGPMGRRLLQNLCEGSHRRWQEATDAAQSALAARRRLWDDIFASLETARMTAETIVEPNQAESWENR